MIPKRFSVNATTRRETRLRPLGRSKVAAAPRLFRSAAALLMATSVAALLAGGASHAVPAASQDQNGTFGGAASPKQPAQGAAADTHTEGVALGVAAPAPIVAAPINAASQLDAVHLVKGYNIPFPSFGDTLLQDYGGWRDKLASYGFGFTANDIDLMAYNVLNTPRSTRAQQAYWGQKFSIGNQFFPWLTYDLSQFGIPDGQIVVSADIASSNWQNYFPNAIAIDRLSYYQTLFNGKLELTGGYMSNSTSFVGTFVGGNLWSTFGPNASIPVEVGLATGPSVQPTVWAKAHIYGYFYHQFGVARSISPTATPTRSDHLVNPSGLDFDQAGSGAVWMNEVGYNRRAAPYQASMWIRAGGIYSNSEYHDYETGGKGRNYAFYLLADRQLFQIDPSSSRFARRGGYLGGTVMYAPPEENIFTQYYEIRAYLLGPLATRPRDQMSVVYNYQRISRYAADMVDRTATQTMTFAQRYANTITGSYTARVTAGLYTTLGLSFSDHPSFSYVKDQGSALNLLGSLFVAF